jgi:tetratricopeptide (TPR) repeat protein
MRGRRPNSLHRLAVAWLLVAACGRTTSEPVEIGPSKQAAEEPSVGEPTPQSKPSGHLARSQSLEGQGDLEGALAAAEAAIDAGGGRDATLQAAKIAILRREYDKASSWLVPLVSAHPDDAAAQYNLALVHHQQGDYNQARNGYLAALRNDRRHADARYNLAVLTHQRGIAEEASHHVEKFRASFPDDPRGPQLERMVGGKGIAGPADTKSPGQ